MNEFQKELLNKVQAHANVDINDVISIAQSIQHVNLKDERVVRDLIQDLSSLVNRPIDKDRENRIVEAILKSESSEQFESFIQRFGRA